MDLHGIQCAIGTLIASRIYEQVKDITPNREKALAYANSFEYEDWSKCLKEFLGKSADEMIALEAKEGKYNKELHAKRLEVIIENWDDILAIIAEELPSSEQIEKIMLEDTSLEMTFKATKDIRDKYVLSRLAWDLGIIEELRY